MLSMEGRVAVITGGCGHIGRAIAEGLDPQTPAITIARATRPDQAVVASPIAELPARLAQAALPGPLLVMLGRVFGEQMAAEAVTPARRHG